eukprot:2609477-Amphidinium_carterae.1
MDCVSNLADKTMACNEEYLSHNQAPSDREGHFSLDARFLGTHAHFLASVTYEQNFQMLKCPFCGLQAFKVQELRNVSCCGWCRDPYRSSASPY